MSNLYPHLENQDQQARQQNVVESNNFNSDNSMGFGPNMNAHPDIVDTENLGRPDTTYQENSNQILNQGQIDTEALKRNAADALKAGWGYLKWGAEKASQKAEEAKLGEKISNATESVR